MSVRQVLVDWLDRVDPDYPRALPIEEQRELVADIFQEDDGYLFDAFAEGLARSPHLLYQLIEFFREGDFLQLGAAVDKAFMNYVMRGEWLSRELQIVAEQEGRYSGE